MFRCLKHLLRVLSVKVNIVVESVITNDWMCHNVSFGRLIRQPSFLKTIYQ